MQLLVPFAARIRTFEARLGYGHALAPLLVGELDFPALETLRLRTADQQRISFASAPELRILDLHDVSVIHFASRDALISQDSSTPSPQAAFSIVLSRASRLTVLQLRWSDWVPSHLPYIFVLCPQLVRLLFYTLEPYDDWGTRFTVAAIDRPVASALRSLDLQLPLDDILEMLDVRFSQTLTDIVVSMMHLSGNSMVSLIDALLLGIGPIITFDLEDSQKLVLHDAAGRARTIRLWGLDESFDIGGIWRCLATYHSAHTSVQRIHIPTPSWVTLASALADYPLQTQQPTTVRILMRWDDVRMLPRRTDLPSIAVPALQRVEFTKFSHSDTEMGITKEAVVYFLRRLSRQADDTRTVDVVLEAPCVIQDAGHAEFLVGSDLESAEQSMCAHVAKEVAGQWRLSFE